MNRASPRGVNNQQVFSKWVNWQSIKVLAHLGMQCTLVLYGAPVILAYKYPNLIFNWLHFQAFLFSLLGPFHSGFPGWWVKIEGMCTHLIYKPYQVLEGQRTYPYLFHRKWWSDQVFLILAFSTDTGFALSCRWALYQWQYWGSMRAFENLAHSLF